MAVRGSASVLLLTDILPLAITYMQENIICLTLLHTTIQPDPVRWWLNTCELDLSISQEPHNLLILNAIGCCHGFRNATRLARLPHPSSLRLLLALKSASYTPVKINTMSTGPWVTHWSYPTGQTSDNIDRLEDCGYTGTHASPCSATKSQPRYSP